MISTAGWTNSWARTLTTHGVTEPVTTDAGKEFARWVTMFVKPNADASSYSYERRYLAAQYQDVLARARHAYRRLAAAPTLEARIAILEQFNSGITGVESNGLRLLIGHLSDAVRGGVTV